MSQLHTDVIKGADYQDRHKTADCLRISCSPSPLSAELRGAPEQELRSSLELRVGQD